MLDPQACRTDSAYARYLEEIEPIRIGPACERWADVQVDPFGYVFRDGRIALENFADQYESREWQLNLRAQTHWEKQLRYWIRNLFYYEKQHIGESWILFVDSFSEGYFHWILETLPRLMYAHKQFPDYGYLIPERLLRIPYVRASLELWFEGVPFKTTQAKTLLCLRAAIFSRRPTKIDHFEPSLIAEFRDYVRAKMTAREQQPRKRLFVSRANVANKRLLNESELEPILEKYGFEKIFFDELSFYEQICVCQACECFVGVHGAGLTNALFLPNGAPFLELRADVLEQATSYERLAAALKIPYWNIIAPAVVPADVDLAHATFKHASFRVEPALFEAQLLQMGLDLA